MLHLEHETFNQANIPTRYAQKRGNRFFIREIVGIRLDPMTPALLQKIACLVVGQWLHLMSKADPPNRVGGRALGVFPGRACEVDTRPNSPRSAKSRMSSNPASLSRLASSTINNSIRGV